MRDISPLVPDGKDTVAARVDKLLEARDLKVVDAREKAVQADVVAKQAAPSKKDTGIFSRVKSLFS